MAWSAPTATVNDPSLRPLPDDDVVRGDGGASAPLQVDITCSVLLSAAAADDALCFTNSLHGMFTQAVLDVWEHGRFLGDHRQFHDRVGARCVVGRVPALARFGVRDEAFETSRPFGL